MNSFTDKLLLDQVEPTTRLRLVEARRKAFGGHVDLALASLSGTIDVLINSEKILDLVALSLLKSELLYLDRQESQAIDVFDSVTSPNMKRLPQNVRLVVDRNRIEVEMALHAPTSGRSFYNLVDRQRLIGFGFHDWWEIVAGDEALADGQYGKSLASSWRELLRTYRQGCWGPHRWATERFARQCLTLRLLDEAAYHSVLALDKTIAGRIADELLASRDVQLISRTIVKLMLVSNLRRHFAIACEILARVGDGVPDDQVDGIAEWLLPRCASPSSDGGSSGLLNMAWKAMEPIACRMSQRLARQAVEVAVNHPSWTTVPAETNRVFLEREQMVDTVRQLVHVLPAAELNALAKRSLSLATTRKQDNDYANVIELLCHIVYRADESVKAFLGDALFPKGQPISFLLGQVASNFGRQFLPSDRLNASAEQVIRNTRLQVQRLPLDQEPQFVPGNWLTSTRIVGDQRLVISFVSGIELEALSRNRRDISPDVLRRLIEAVLEMINDRENEPSNRAKLTHGLKDFGDCLSDDLISSVFSTLISLAAGQVQVSEYVRPMTEAENLLNPIKFNTTSPSEIQGMALYALARIIKQRPDKNISRIDTLIEESLTSLDSTIRQMAFSAAREMPKLSETTLMAVLLGLRDTDADAASSAFSVFAAKNDLGLTRNHWRLFIYAAFMASRSPSVKLRRAAASATSALYGRVPSDSLRVKMANLTEQFRADTCASVRKAIDYSKNL